MMHADVFERLRNKDKRVTGPAVSLTGIPADKPVLSTETVIFSRLQVHQQYLLE